MSLLSQRQKNILLQLATRSDGLKIKDLADLTAASKRTVYRELPLIDNFLKARRIKLAAHNGVYSLEGKKDELEKLLGTLYSQSSKPELTVRQRQAAIVSILLLDDQPRKILSLALRLEVSEGTIQSDLKSVEKALLNYGLQLRVKKAVGVEIFGDEVRRRLVLAGILASQLNAYEFFRYLSGDSESLDRSFFAKLIPKNILQKSYQVLQETQLTNKTRSDVQEVQLVLILSISLLRLQKHALQKYPIKEPQNLFKYRREALSIFQKYNPAIKSKVTTAEIDFLSARFKALDYWVDPRSWDNFFDLKVNLLVKKLIQLVSDQVGWNFSRDINLFSRLSSHISLLLRHNDMSFPADKVGTLDEVSDKYPELLDAISDGLSKTFQNNYFPNAEKDLILLYFANSFENSENINGLRALVICANGLGAASILKNRLKQEVPIVSDVEIAKVSHLQKIDPSKFDLILSTIDLPGSDWNYLIVSPLLLSNEIAKVKDYVSKIKKTAVKHFNLKNVAQDPASSSVYLSNMSKQIDLSQKLLSEIKLEQIDYKGKTDLKDILQKILSIIPTDLISNKKTVIEKMLKRVDQAPVGIPDSSVALIHTTDSSVKFPFFSIYQLQHPIMMKSMDYQNIQIKRILLMAAPDSMDGFENNLMASISSSIVSSHQNLEIYQKADQATIKDLIADQFLKQIEINKESELSQ